MVGKNIQQTMLRVIVFEMNQTKNMLGVVTFEMQADTILGVVGFKMRQETFARNKYMQAKTK